MSAESLSSHLRLASSALSSAIGTDDMDGEALVEGDGALSPDKITAGRGMGHICMTRFLTVFKSPATDIGAGISLMPTYEYSLWFDFGRPNVKPRALARIHYQNRKRS